MSEKEGVTHYHGLSGLGERPNMHPDWVGGNTGFTQETKVWRVSAEIVNFPSLCEDGMNDDQKEPVRKAAG